jgi:hypothetical protein
MPQLAKSLGLDLPNPLARDPKFAANFLKSAKLTVLKTKTKGDDSALSL